MQQSASADVSIVTKANADNSLQSTAVENMTKQSCEGESIVAMELEEGGELQEDHFTASDNMVTCNTTEQSREGRSVVAMVLEEEEKNGELQEDHFSEVSTHTFIHHF